MAYLAIDLGAGSGRVIAGAAADGRLTLDEVHRFENRPVERDGALRWDLERLFAEILEGIRRAVERGIRVDGIGVDTWGVDFGLVGAGGELIESPVCYRDPRTDGLAAEARRHLSDERFYAITGIQQMEINTVYQLLSLQRRGDGRIKAADKLLFTPDLLSYMLTGRLCCEYTIASTSQLLDAGTRDWSPEILDALLIPRRIMPRIVAPGTLLGPLRPEIARQTGAAGARVFAVGAHDTASAIAALPADAEDRAFLSCGTWSLLGVTTDTPIRTEEARRGHFTNEGGVGKILFMRNITGLWLLQRLMAEWKAAGEACSYDELLARCSAAEPHRSVVDTDDPAFSNPASMAGAIRAVCRATGQPEPATTGELVRCVLESLALKYRTVIEALQRCTGRRLRQLCVVGGGSRNRLLMQFVADATGLEVLTGLTEATAAGNIAQQAIADGAVADWAQAHAIIARTVGEERFRPDEASRAAWERAAARYASLLPEN